MKWGYSTMEVHTAVNRRVIGSSPIIPVWSGSTRMMLVRAGNLTENDKTDIGWSI